MVYRSVYLGSVLCGGGNYRLARLVIFLLLSLFSLSLFSAPLTHNNVARQQLQLQKKIQRQLKRELSPLQQKLPSSPQPSKSDTPLKPQARFAPALALPISEILGTVIARRAAMYAIELGMDIAFATRFATATASIVGRSLVSRAALVPVSSVLRTAGKLSWIGVGAVAGGAALVELEQRGAFVFSSSDIAPNNKYQVAFEADSNPIVLYHDVHPNEISDYNPTIVSINPKAAAIETHPNFVETKAKLTDCLGYRYFTFIRQYYCSNNMDSLRDAYEGTFEETFNTYKDTGYGGYQKTTFIDATVTGEGFNYNVRNSEIGHIFSANIGPVFTVNYAINYRTQTHSCDSSGKCNDSDYVTTGTPTPYFQLNPDYYLVNGTLDDHFKGKDVPPLGFSGVAETVSGVLAIAAQGVDYDGIPYYPVGTLDISEAMGLTAVDAQAIDFTEVLENATDTSDIIYVPVIPVPEVGEGTGPGTGTGTVINNYYTTNNYIENNVDLGEDPGIGAPELEDIPTGYQILKPLLDLFPFLKSPNITAHAASCPIAKFELPSLKRTFVMDLHCDIVEQNRQMIMTIFGVLWSLLALRVILTA